MSAAAAAAAAPQQSEEPEMPMLEMPDGLFQFTEAAGGWKDQLTFLKEEAKRLRPCTLQMFNKIRVDEAIASPEAFDKQTDMLFRDIDPPTEVLKQAIVKKAKDLSEGDIVDTADTLLSFLTQFARGTPSSITVETCFYVHEQSFVAGSPLEPFLDAMLRAMMHVTHLVDATSTRDGDEEFSLGFVASKAGTALANADNVDVDFDKLNAEIAKGGKLAKRFALLAAFCKYSSAGMKLITEGAVKSSEQVTAAAANLAAAGEALRDARDSAPVPPKTAFTPMGAMWDTASIPHVAVDPCPWAESINFYTELAADAKMLVDKWLPLQGDLVLLLETVQQYCLRESAPALLARGFATAFVLHGQHVCGGEAFVIVLVDVLRTRFGAPWYGALVKPLNDEETALAKAVVDHKLKDAPRGSQPSEEEMRTQLSRSLHPVVVEISRVFMRLIHTYLRNRGRCHRMLLNLLPEIAQFQAAAMQVDSRVFSNPSGAYLKGNREHQEVVMRQSVLQAYLTDLLMDTCYNILVLTQRLGLLTSPELLPITQYYSHFLQVRAQSFTVLYPSEQSVRDAHEHGKRRGAPPTLATRKATVAPQSLLATMDVSLMFVRGLGWALTATKSSVPALHMPPDSLQTLENVFNHRFLTLQTSLRGQVLGCKEAIDTFKTGGDSAKAVSVSVDHFKRIHQSMAQHIARIGDDINAPSKRLLEALDKAAKKNAVIVGLVTKVDGYTVELQADPEFPFVLTLNATKAATE